MKGPKVIEVILGLMVLVVLSIALGLASRTSTLKEENARLVDEKLACEGQKATCEQLRQEQDGYVADARLAKENYAWKLALTVAGLKSEREYTRRLERDFDHNLRVIGEQRRRVVQLENEVSRLAAKLDGLLREGGRGGQSGLRRVGDAGD